MELHPAWFSHRAYRAGKTSKHFSASFFHSLGRPFLEKPYRTTTFPGPVIPLDPADDIDIHHIMDTTVYLLEICVRQLLVLFL